VLAAVGTACAVQVNDGVVVAVVVLALAASEHSTTRFLAVSIYHVELLAVVLPLVPVVALAPLENNGMYGIWLLEVVVVCADAIPIGIANVAANRESDFMSGSLLSKKPFQYGGRLANINMQLERAAPIGTKCVTHLIQVFGTAIRRTFLTDGVCKVAVSNDGPQEAADSSGWPDLAVETRLFQRASGSGVLISYLVFKK
jgi:hypothetical protein